MKNKRLILGFFLSVFFLLTVDFVIGTCIGYCDSQSKESNEGPCCGSDYEECTDEYTRSTATVNDCFYDSKTDYCINQKKVREYFIECWYWFNDCDYIEYTDITCRAGYECKDGACKRCLDNDQDSFCDTFEDRCVGTTGSCSGCNYPTCGECTESECPTFPSTTYPYCKNSASSRQCGNDYDEYDCYTGSYPGSDIYVRKHDYHCNGGGSCLDYPNDWSTVQDCLDNEQCSCTGINRNDCHCIPINNCNIDNDQDGYYKKDSNCPNNNDCNDNNANIHPGASETCNNIDDDCDNQVDESLSQSQSCGSGSCQGTQSRSCTNGIWASWSSCSTEGGSCGTKDCDYLDTECRDYSDKIKYCSNGICQDPSCTQYVDKPTSTQCGTDYYEYGCPWGTNLGDDTGIKLHDYHCNGAGGCLDYPQGWVVDEYCTNIQKCYWDGINQGDDNYYCKEDCVDNDQDGYYPTTCPNGNDCNDNDNTIHPNAPELCDNKDNNCNQQIDESLVQNCPKQSGVCQGATKTCSNGQWGNCNYGQYYETTEVTCDNKDNDCDGQVDESSVVCPSGQTCSNGQCRGPTTLTVTRQAPASANPSSSFIVTYTAIGDNTKWAVPIEDTITGGCTPTSAKTVIMHDIGEATTLTETYTFTTPSSGSCTFTGFWTDTYSIVHNFANAVVYICSNECTSGTKQCSGNGYQTCGNYDADACTEWSSVTGCSGVTPYCGNGNCVQCNTNDQCSGQTTCYTATCSSNSCNYVNNCNIADSDKNGCVSTSELITFINKWASNTETTANLISAINAWVSGMC